MIALNRLTWGKRNIPVPFRRQCGRVARVHVHLLPTPSDTHDHRVKRDVWELYRYVHGRTGGVTTVLEWDAEFLTFEETLAEAKIAREYQDAPVETR